MRLLLDCMMTFKNTLLGFILFLGGIQGAFAQKNKTAANPTATTIIRLRAHLKTALLANDKKEGAILMDSLRALPHEPILPLLWDERWLLYHWSDQQKLLLEETQKFTWEHRMVEEYSQHPPADKLFNLVDSIMLAQSNTYPALLQDLGFNPEDQEFLMLHLQYLLRNNSENEKTIRKEFLELYPNTRHKTFIKTFMELPPRPRSEWVAAELALIQNNWQPDLDRHLSVGWGAYFSLFVIKNRWSWGGHVGLSRQKNLRDIYSPNNVFDKGARSSLDYYGLSASYGLFDRPSMRVGPFVNLGLAHFQAIPPDEEELLGIYDDFDYFGVQAGAGISVELKFKKRTLTPKSILPPTYRGMRLRAGFNYMNLGRKNDQLDGNVFFITVGYQLANTQ